MIKNNDRKGHFSIQLKRSLIYRYYGKILSL